MEKENKTKHIDIVDLIALCHILNDYDKFTKDLIKLTKNRLYEYLEKSDVSKIYDLYDISRGKDIDDIYEENNNNNNNNYYNIDKKQYLNDLKKLKKFYLDNKSVIDTVNKYSDIKHFMLYHYDGVKKLIEDSVVDYFYKYIVNHTHSQKDLERIISLLEKIKKLGFSSLDFNEELNFTNNNYEINTIFDFFDDNYEDNFDVFYLDNIEIIPNYQSHIVKYKTTGSNFEIFAYVPDYETCIPEKIRVNSLLFDPKRLPNEITKESIFDSIVSLNKKQKKNCDIIRNSVNLSIGVDDLYSKFSDTNKIVKNLKNVESKEKILEILLNIKTYLEQLQSLSTQYDDSVIQNDSSITKERLEEEKRLYKKRRDLNNDSE